MEEPSLQRLREAILDSVDEGIRVLDSSGAILFENAASAALFGGGPRGNGQRAHALAHARREDGTEHPWDHCPIARTLRDGRTRRREDDYFWRPDGTGFPVDYCVSPLRDPAGAVTGAVVSFHDATGRREAARLARELEDERARLVAAQSVAKIGSWETDLRTLAVVWSTETHRIFETDPAVFRPTHQGFLEFLPPDDRAAVAAAFTQSAGSESPRSIEHRVLLPGGRVKIVEERWRAFKDESGRFAKAIGTCQDVTERKRTEALLQESEEKFSKLFESSPAKIAIGTMSGELVDVNRAYAEFFGFSRDEMRGKSIADLGIVSPAAMRSLLALGRGPGIAMRDIEISMRGRDGGILLVMMSADIITLKGVPHRVATLVDITALRRAEDERRKLQEQALRAQRMESIGTLAGGIAHDLNNSLSPIKMSLQLLRDRFPDRESAEILATLEDCVEHAAGMVRQVLTFARGIEGRRIPLDPLAIAQDTIKIVRDTFPKSIACELAAAPDPGVVVGDPTQLHQVLLNLCVNARDAMPQGGRLTIGVESVHFDAAAAGLLPGARPGAFVRFAVSDTGAGIAAEDRERIFEPFFTTKEVGSGTGLGLSTTLAIVKSHGGFISLESEPGRGARFLVHLPARAGAPGPLVGGAAPPPEGRGELVLVVDDNESIRTMTKRTLESANYRVLLAPDGKAALALYAQRRLEISAVLTDMAMPVMDGPALIAALRALDPGVPIVGSSGQWPGGADPASGGLALVRFLAKPYSARDLLEVLRRSMDESKKSRPA